MELGKYAPALATIVAGIVAAIINYVVANRTIKSNQANIDKQISNAQTLLEKQIQHGREIAALQVKSQFAINNEKEWLISVRKYLATILCQTSFMVHSRAIHTNNTNDADKYRNANDEVISSQSMLLLLLDENNILQAELIEIMNNVVEMGTDDNYFGDEIFDNVVHK
jgi:hypothetical protein